MARAFPLADPAGRVYLYACGRCHHVAHGGERLVELDGPDASLVASSRLLAERCCTCERCGTEVGRPELFEPRVCATCRPTYDSEKAAREARFAARAAEMQVAFDAALTSALDRDVALHLLNVMRDISEDHWCASWMGGLEHELWRMLVNGSDGTYGMGELSTEEIDDLRRLHEKAGGWWYWHDEKAEPGLDPLEFGPRFVSTDRWKEISAS